MSDAPPPAVQPPNKHGWGWRRSRPDFRDFFTEPKPRTLRGLTPTSDLRDAFPEPPWDQGRIGSCTAQAWGALFDAVRKRAGRRMWTPSRLFLYWVEREIEGTIAVDVGAEMRTGALALRRYGVGPESYWTYDDTPARQDGSWALSAKPRRRPAARAFSSALNYQGTSFAALRQDLGVLRGMLCEGTPFTFGFSVYSSLYDPHTGRPRDVLPMPARSDTLLGGHAIVACGHNDTPQPYNLRTRELMPIGYTARAGDQLLPPLHFLIRNSWGVDAQMGGYFAFPYSYAMDRNLASDYWVITTTEA